MRTIIFNFKIGWFNRSSKYFTLNLTVLIILMGNILQIFFTKSGSKQPSVKFEAVQDFQRRKFILIRNCLFEACFRYPLAVLPTLFFVKTLQIFKNYKTLRVIFKAKKQILTIFFFEVHFCKN